MASHQDSQVASVMKNLDLSLRLEIPIPAPSDSSSCCPSISLALDGIQLATLEPPPPISPPSPSDLAAIGNSPWLPTTSDPVP